MKVFTYLMIIGFAGIYLVSCSNNAKTTDQKDEKSNTTSHQHNTAEVKLNNGDPWEANPETTEGINNMQAIITDFTNTGDKKDYTALKDTLSHEFQSIFKNCTMKGEAHNNLHSYLMPVSDLLKQIDSEDPNKSEKAIVELNKQLETYPNYFQ